MFIKDSKRFNIYAPFTHDGAEWPRFPMDRAEEFGVTEIPEPQPPEPPEGFTVDEAFYRNEQDDAPYVTWTPKSDEQLAQIRQGKINAQSLAYLASTDWMVTRFAETGVPIPDEVKTKRAEARAAIVHP